MKNIRSLVLIAAALVLPVAACAQQDAGSATAALTEGRYDDAIRIATAAVEANPADRPARRTLLSALIDVGRYEEAVSQAGDLHNLRGEALESLGRVEEAEAAYRAAIDAGDEDRWTAEFNLAELMFDRCAREVAHERFDRFIELYNQSSSLGSADLTAVGNAVRFLGVLDPQLFHDAVLAYDEAIAADPSAIEPHIRMGELFVEKYNSTEAYGALNDALALNPRHPRALLATARAKQFDGERGEAMDLVTQALEVNPNLVPARVFLARINLDVENHEEAEAELQKALEINGRSLEALSMLAAVHFLRDDRGAYEEVTARIRGLNPRYAGHLATVAEIAAQQRRYAEAAELAEEAVALDPELWSGYGVLGLNQFRLGRIDAARAALEAAFAGDPYNAWIKNNLDLLDTFSQYEMRTVSGLEFMIHRDEVELLLPYLEVAAVEAHRELTERYGDRPRGPVRIELYPRSADFSVRTIGLAGMGALGVSFGDVVALDSPSAREPGRYNWVTTLWHELAHTIALGVSNSRVPRWLTEGLSVVEERRARPGWNVPIKPELLIMYDEGELPPPSRLSEGFIRPESPQHLTGAYDLASLVATWIEETRGFEAIVRILHGYRDGRPESQIFESVLGMSAERMDEEFDRWLRARSDPSSAREFGRLMREAGEQVQAGAMNQAKRNLEAAGALFPTSSGGSPYSRLAEIYLSEGNEPAAIEALKKLTEADETAYEPNLVLSGLLEKTGDTAGAIRALERAVWIHPYDPATHQKLAEMYAAAGDFPQAVRERRALLGLRPTDMADAHYQLARVLMQAGDRVAARQAVLRALEVAPNFQQAQELLLQLHEG